MKKVLSIVLYLLAVASIILLAIEPNAEIFGIPQSFITTALITIAAVKEIIQSAYLLTPEEAAQEAVYFANSMRIPSRTSGGDKPLTVEDFKNWKKQYE